MGLYRVSYLWKDTIQSLELCVLHRDLTKICWNSLAKHLKLTMMNINHSDFQSFDRLISSGSGWRLNLSALFKRLSWSKPCKNEFEQVSKTKFQYVSKTGPLWMFSSYRGIIMI